MRRPDILSVSVIILTLIQISSGWLLPSSRYCAEVGEAFTKNYPFNTLPLPECFTTRFHLYTKTWGTSYNDQINTGYIPSSFDATKKTIFIVHGFNDAYGSIWMNLIKALFQQGDFNIITTDWSDGAHRSLLLGYDNAAANARVSGKALHNLFKSLQQRGLSRSNGHCIGHSLGAHVCGYAGQYQKFGRISGLDPAGPELESLSEGARLSKDDADFVDVLHTNGGGNYLLDYGTLIAMGHLDFYANGGKTQPGCINKRGAVVRAVSCSHTRALPLYTETVNSPKCVATVKYSSATVQTLYQCSSCGSYHIIVGYHSVYYSHSPGKYGFTTNSSSPYC